MFFHSPFDILILAVALSIVIKPITRAVGELAKARGSQREAARVAPPPMDDESRERIEALEERLRLVEERQDFTEKLVSGRRDEASLPPPAEATPSPGQAAPEPPRIAGDDLAGA